MYEIRTCLCRLARWVTTLACTLNYALGSAEPTVKVFMLVNVFVFTNVR